MKFGELLEFRKDLYFEGAVQIDWFYDQSRAAKVAENFVFHGKKRWQLVAKKQRKQADRLTQQITVEDRPQCRIVRKDAGQIEQAHARECRNKNQRDRRTQHQIQRKDFLQPVLLVRTEIPAADDRAASRQDRIDRSQQHAQRTAGHGHEHGGMRRAVEAHRGAHLEGSRDPELSG